MVDFEGQKLSEYIYQVVIVVLGVIGFFVGFAYQDFGITAYFVFAGMAISFVICVPDWPFLNRNPLVWLEGDAAKKKKADAAAKAAGKDTKSD